MNASAKTAQQQAVKLARKIVPRVPRPGEELVFVGKAKVVPKVEVKLQSGRRITVAGIKIAPPKAKGP